VEKLIAGARKLGLHLSPKQLKQFQAYYQELVEWNERVNLTSITAYEDVQTRHFLDSLTITIAWQQPIGFGGVRVIDIGSGAGLPGIPLKIAFSEIKLVLLETTAKKAAFLQHIKQKLGLDDIEIVVGRAEDVARQPEYRERFEVVLSRAVASLASLAELTLPFCAVGGSLVAQKKGAIDQEVKQASKAISLMGGNLREVKRVELEEFADERWLVIINKISPTPQQYPRRPGIPSKRPILDKHSNE